MRLPAAAGALALVVGSLTGCAAGPEPVRAVVRLANAQPASPTSAAVEVPASFTLVFVSGQTGTPPGDTHEQTLQALDKAEAVLGRAGLGLADVVKATVFLVAPAVGERADVAGFARAWRERFGTPRVPDRPARSTVQVAALGAPGVWVEIEVIAARAP